MAAPLRLYWWRWKFPHRLNFGDELSAPLLERITGRRVEWTALETCDVVGAGSILQKVVRAKRSDSPSVWGSGLIQPPAVGAIPISGDVRAVRGELTRAYLSPVLQDTVALGDPGLLASHLIDGTVRKKYTLGFVPHYKDTKSPVVREAAALGNGVRIIDVAWTPEEVAREIASCEVIVSSSMHGLIFADALGVPNSHIQLGDRLVGGLHKFQDYDSAIGRLEHRTIEWGKSVSTVQRVDAVKANYVAPIDLEKIQNGLIAAIPNP